MQTQHPDAFALKNAGFDAFLYADVGAELNGSVLTVLSMLARLGRDPWAEAAKWTALPRAAVIDSLAESIDQMPLASPGVAATRTIAARLIQLLPAKTSSVRQDGVAETRTASVPPRGLLILYCALAVGMAFNALFVPRPSAAPPGQPIEASNGAISGWLPQHGPTAAPEPPYPGGEQN